MVVDARFDADAYLVNTCTVTAEADRKARQWLRGVRRRHPCSLMVASGCAVERAPEQLEPLADLLIGNRQKNEVVDLVVSKLDARHSHASGIRLRSTSDALPVGRTRSLIRVQQGCASHCAFCVVPFVRGEELSLPVDGILSAIQERIGMGCKEIVLTGTKIGAYRDGETTLPGLVEKVLSLPGLLRLRLSSLQPQELSDDLLSLWSDRRLCRHFHLSLQSGSETVLRRMGRLYSLSGYLQAVKRIRWMIPEAAITTDVIVGFPSESDEEFRSTIQFIEKVVFARIHVFPYSRRPGTRAAEMPGQVPSPIVRQRAAILEGVAANSRHAYARSWLGRRVNVLWEEETVPGSGIFAGTTDNYLRTMCYSSIPLQNTLETVALARLESQGVWVRRGVEDTGRREAEF